MKLNSDQLQDIKRKLRSISLFLSAHPENIEDSEMADRLDDIEELEVLFMGKY